MALLAASCENSGENQVDGETVPPLPEKAIVEAYNDNSGIAQVTIKDGTILEERGNYWKNKRHGIWTTFFSDGNVKSITGYLNGKKYGTFVEFTDRGYLSKKGSYARDLLSGEMIIFSYNKKVEQRNYKDGLLEGPLRKFYRDGTLKEESYYKAGKLDGVARWYDAEGNLTIEYEYVDGEWIKPDSL
jgi:antitoxin component YwqK of YwqJK toxin-antitoxin module